MGTRTIPVSERARNRKTKVKSSAKSSASAAKPQTSPRNGANAEPLFFDVQHSAARRSNSPLGNGASFASAAAFARASRSAVALWLSSPGTARTLMNLAHDAVIIRNPESVIESWNTGAEETYGWNTQEAIGKISHELLDTQFPVSLEAADETLFKHGYWEGELQHRRKDGRRIIVLSRWSLLRTDSGHPLLVKEINRDVTQERRRLGYLRLLSEVSEAVIEAQSVSEALRSSLASICAHTPWCAGRALWLGPENSIQQPQAVVWHASEDERLRAVRQALERRRIQIGEAHLAARAIESSQPAWILNLSADPYFKNIPELAQAGLVSAFAQPVAALGTNAALLLFSEMPVEIDEPFLSVMSSVAAHLRRLFERFAAQDAQRRLSLSLMHAQDDERRRIARELHDSAGQYLGALGLSIEAVRRAFSSGVPPAVEEKLAEADDIVARCSAELRTLSHLLHPPLLEDLGLASAVNCYIAGFAERSGIQVSADVGDLPRFADSIELTLFRVLQECLTNIHRHSGSKTASVRMEAGEQSVTLEICDQGKGIPAETLRGWSRKTLRAGVGISGMRERLKDLGGSFEINSDKGGTRVRASIPLRNAASSALADGAPAGSSPAALGRDGANGKILAENARHEASPRGSAPLGPDSSPVSAPSRENHARRAAVSAGSSKTS